MSIDGEQILSMALSRMIAA